MAGRAPVEADSTLQPPENGAERRMPVRVGDLGVFAFYFPRCHQMIEVCEFLGSAAPALPNRPCLLLGDFNAEMRRANKDGSTLIAADRFQWLLEMGRIDIRRTFHPSGRDQ